METSTKKTKLTLTVRKDIIEKAKLRAREQGKSISNYFEEIVKSDITMVEEKKKRKKAMEALNTLLKDAEPLEALSESDKELWQKHLDEKYG